MVEGQTADTIDPACLPALTVEDGVVTGIVADPPPDATRACADTASLGGFDSASGSGFEPAPVPTKATLPVQSTTP
jgi:hypothetical protein